MPKPEKKSRARKSRDTTIQGGVELAARQRDAYALRESLKWSAPSADDADGPEDIDVVRLTLARRIRTLIGDPRRCRDPACRRTRRCAGPDMRCARDQPAPPMTAEEWGRIKAEFLRALKHRAEEAGQAERS